LVQGQVLGLDLIYSQRQIPTYESTGVRSVHNGLVEDVPDIHKTSEEPHKRIPPSQYWEDDLNNISLTAGLLAVASYPLVTTEWSNTNRFHVSPKQIQSFAAWTVTFFMAEQSPYWWYAFGVLLTSKAWA
jgi:hypothetical protein